jgi:DNA-binding NtrC family response regulator
MSRLLIFERDEVSANSLRDALTREQFWVISCYENRQASELLQKQHFHICLWHAETDEDLAHLQQAKQLRPHTQFVVASDRSEPAFVVQAMRAGAGQFWVRHENLDQLITLLKDIFMRVVPGAGVSHDVDFPIPEFVGRHPKMLEIFQLIMSIKDTDSNVLITGESGTGKEVVARAIHNLSPRRRQPWVAVNCGAIPGSLLESELFGHMKGSFTGATQNRVGRFQKAANGTLFLDEISDLPVDLQAKILRAIQHKLFEPVGSVNSLSLDARIIAATNQDLQEAVKEKRFREDLFYRLNVIPIVIPPLRSRKSDIPLLVKTFVDRFTANYRKEITGISEEAMSTLMNHHWPGNIRELENLMERVVVLKRDSGLLEMKDLPLDHFKNVGLDRFVATVSLPEDGLDFNQAVNEFENELILQALQKTAGNKNKAASLLNLNRTTLVEKLKRKGLRIAS